MRSGGELKDSHSDKDAGLAAKEHDPGPLAIVGICAIPDVGSPSDLSGIAIGEDPLKGVAVPLNLHG